MSALFKDEYNPSKKAEAVLDYVLRDTHESPEAVHDEVTVGEELSSVPLIGTQNTRFKSRILFLTREIHVLEEHSPLRAHIRSIAQGFDEVHVVVLATVYEAKKGIVRDGLNIWLYTTGSRNNLWHYFAAAKTIREQLVFSEGFRPDAVIALEPFVSGFVGTLIAERYNRPFQVHVREDFTNETFRSTHESAKWLVRLARFVLSHAHSIRCSSERIAEHIRVYLSKSADVRILPKFMNIEALTSGHRVESEKDLFPHFSFVILFVGTLDTESTLFRAIDAARSALFAKSIGMAVIGDGSRRSEFIERANILGVSEQIVFIKDTHSVRLALSQADVLLCTDADETSDSLVVEAAALGLPLLVAENDFRRNLFIDGEDAFLCPKDDTVCFSQKLNKFLNNVSLRVQFANNARGIVKTRLHEDPEVFVRAYKDSVERVFEDVPGIKMS
jgi:glycosyltransferase involved in cell wall biosynthesis